MNTLVKRIPIEADTLLEERIATLGDLHLAAGYALAAMQVIGTDVLLVFQKLPVPGK